MEFVAKSPATQKVLNTLRVSANLPVNILIWGERGTGKKTLVQSVFKDAIPLGVDEVKERLASQKDLYIYDLERCEHLPALMGRLEGSRVIATANSYKEAYEDYFPVILHIPPLKERPEDLAELTRRYVAEARAVFGADIDTEALRPDLSQNAISLKRSIFTQAVLDSLDETELMGLLERFFAKKLEEGYKSLLRFFEIPLLRAAKRKYRSNLAISKALGLNRATVTTKVERYKEWLD
jgi:DNA-binding NtrC family response regulator